MAKVMFAYRYKNPSRDISKCPPRIDLTIDARQFKRGMIVWVDGPSVREERICTGIPGECVTRQEWHNRRREEAARNRLARPYVRPSGRSMHSFTNW